MQSSYGTNFGAQQGILSNLTDVLNPIAEAGPNQEGFSGAEKSALNASAINQNAANYRNASTVVAGGQAGAGGNTYAPTGGQQQVAATIASNAAQNLSGTENQITQADYAQGRQNFGNAVSGLEGVAGQYNPNATGGLALNANENAFGQANANQSGIECLGWRCGRCMYWQDLGGSHARTEISETHRGNRGFAG